EEHGVDANRGVAINEMWDDMTAKDLTAKLWPQTERLKAWCAVLDAAASAREVAHATPRLIGAAAGLVKYLTGPTPGLWYETCLPSGHFIAEPSKASSLYHIVGAIEALGKTVATAIAAQAPR
ncbi:MAG: AGE family epimerase/isomerase, partial [Pseudomonadota bacterium]|nr:AGE family epimerase/isomerase [Pseudomonadota bacterium]